MPDRGTLDDPVELYYTDASLPGAYREHKGFRCASCTMLIGYDDEFIWLPNDRPMCSHCCISRQCHGCRQPIQKDAIVNGPDAYHAECFRSADANIVFTQTGKDVFRKPCHEMRKQKLPKKLSNTPIKQRSDSLESHERVSDELSPSTERAAGSMDSNNSRPLRGPTGNRVLNPQQLCELDDVEVAAASRENMPSPPQTQTSESPSSHTTFLSLDIDRDLFELPKPVYSDTQSSVSHREPSYEALKRDLEITKSRLSEVEKKHMKYKTVVRKDLDEADAIKEDIATQVSARHKAESLVEKLQSELSLYRQQPSSTSVPSDDMNRVLQSKSDLEQACDELRVQRDKLVEGIKKAAGDVQQALESYSNLPSEHWDTLHHSYKLQLQSVKADIDVAKSRLARLEKSRDEVIGEMIMLNTKNAELSNMNNDLSRRVTERERETMAFMAGTSFVQSTPSTTTSIETSSQSGSEGHARPIPQKSLEELQKEEVPHPSGLFTTFKRSRNILGKKLAKSSGGKKEEDDSGATASHGRPSPLEHLHPEEQLVQANHRFVSVKFLRPTRCDVCTDKIKRSSEFKCQGCGINCHAKCAQAIHQPCAGHDSQGLSGERTPKSPWKSSTSQVNMLAKQVQIEGGDVPLLVQKCIEAVEKRGLDFEGIYRKSGGASQMRMIQQAFEEDPLSLDLCDEEKWNDICAVSSVLKQYFRDLSDPLFTYEHHPRIVETIRESSVDPLRAIARMYDILHTLPIENYDTIKFLMTHLKHVEQHHEENRMTSKNLAVVFGPTLLRNVDENKDLSDMSYKIKAVDFILKHTAKLFADEAPPVPSNKETSNPLPVRPPPVFPRTYDENRGDGELSFSRHSPGPRSA